ncbi:hypothetical protein XENOCAPTIV_012837 [Xenoophorus captivus]|uniref:Protein kinase domain-containing protein n=1 Tax=Xenoophorus captivus TaxID=1517983 RepID=A0ABV0RKM1_9TELE
MSRCPNSGSTATSDDQPHIGNYRLLKTIGKGNFAKVKLARHVLTGKETVQLEASFSRSSGTMHQPPAIAAFSPLFTQLFNVTVDGTYYCWSLIGYPLFLLTLD